jgi:hypothetical protein
VTWVTHLFVPCTYHTRRILLNVKKGGCFMVAIKLPNLTSTFHFTLIAVLLIVGLLFWAVGTR